MSDEPAGAIGLKSSGEVRVKREQVLARYQNFKEAAKSRRAKLEGARKFQQFRRDADELEAWVVEKINVVSADAYKDRTNLQVRDIGWA